MGRIKKWIINFAWLLIAGVGTMYIIYYCTGWRWFHLSTEQLFFFTVYCSLAATDAVMPRWRIRPYWRLTSQDNLGKSYTKFFHVEKRVATFFWRKWYATQDEERATEIFEALNNNF